MSIKKKIILLKLSGEAFISKDHSTVDATVVRSYARQIKTLWDSHQFGIVIGGGNFFRGNQHGKRLGISNSASHQAGMLATMMNGLILQDIFGQEQVPSTLFCALDCPSIGNPLAPQAIQTAMAQEQCVIFTGGMGNPFFTTDTTAIVRGLQIKAAEVWKATKVDGIYSDDPNKNPEAHLLRQVSYAEALTQRLGIMDATALALAQEHHMPIRVFSLFVPDSLIRAATDNNFGSTVQ